MARYRIVEELVDGKHYAYKVQEKIAWNGWTNVTFLNSDMTLKECEDWINRALKPKPAFTLKVVKEYG